MSNKYQISSNKSEALKTLGYQGIEVVDADEVQDISAYGKPIFMSLYLGDEGLDEISYTLKGQTFAVSGMKLICCVVDISNTRNIVKTTIQGRNGTVKEFINNGDYIVNIKGILGNDVFGLAENGYQKANNKYPTEAVRNLHEICKIPATIPVVHPLLYELGIYDLVIESFSFPATPGKENIQTFELNCVSDTTFVLQEKENETILNS